MKANDIAIPSMRVSTWIHFFIRWRSRVAHRYPVPAWVLWFYWWIQTSGRCPRCRGRASRCSWSVSPPPAGRLSRRSLNETTRRQTAVKTARGQTGRAQTHTDRHTEMNYMKKIWLEWSHKDSHRWVTYNWRWHRKIIYHIKEKMRESTHLRSAADR